MGDLLRDGLGKALRFTLRTLLRVRALRRIMVRILVPELFGQLRRLDSAWDSPIERELFQVALLKDPTSVAADEIARLASGERPVVAGPWLGEVGFELLYWIPFLRWIAECEPALARRMTIMSRGGAQPWYAGLGDGYVDVFEFVSPEELVAELHSEPEAKQKQLRPSAFDRRLLERAMAAHGLGDAQALHPSTFFQVFRYLRQQEAIPRLQAVSRYEPIPAPPLGELEGLLPDEFVVARFYFSYAFPDTPENRAFVQRALAALTEQTNVVVISLPFRVDDHVDFPGGGGQVVRIDELMRPQTNLAVQTAAIARARAFVGTYGGFSYLAPYLGVPSVSWYSRPQSFLPAHLDLAGRVFAGERFGDFLALDTAHAPLLDRLLADRAIGSREP